MNQLIIDGYTVEEYIGKNIFVVKNAISYNDCDHFINITNTSTLSLRKFKEGNNVECYEVTNLYNHDINAQYNKLLLIIKNICKYYNIPFFGTTELSLRKVYGETRAHIDGACQDESIHPYTLQKIKAIRSLTCVCALNDDYQGGVYNFTIQNISVKINKGDIILFPPYWTHVHSVSKINNENNTKYRYIASFWILDDFLTKSNNDINNIILI